jgi:zinc protease
MAPRGWWLLVVILAGCAARAPSRTIRFQSTVHSARLASGMRVLVIEDHETNLVHLGIRLDAGAVDDPPGKAGLAHLVEHILFEIEAGSERRPLRSLLSASALGFNAFTSYQATTYVEMARADQLASLLETEWTRFAAPCPSISQEAFEREREVVRNELRLRRSFSSWENDLAVLYPPNHPYARPIGGTDASVARLTIDDVCRFVERHYQPDRMVVTVTGDVDARAAIHGVAATLGRMAGHSRGPRSEARPLPAIRRVQAPVPMNMKGPVLIIEWPLPASWSPDYPAAEVAFSLVGRAFRRRFPAGILFQWTGDSSLAVALLPLPGGATDDARVAAVLDDVDRAIDGAAGRVDEELLERLANRRVRTLLEEFDSMETRTLRMGEAFQLAGDDHVFVHQMVRFDNLDRAAVRAAASRVFARERRSLVVVTPHAARAAAADAGPAFAGRTHEEEWQAPVDPREADRPLRVPVPPSRLARAERYRLRSGLTVIMLRAGAAPLVSARLVFAGGSADDPPGKDGVGYLAARLRRFGRAAPRRGRDYTPAEALAHFADDLTAGGDRDSTTFGTDGLSSHLDAVLSGLSSLVVDGEYRDGDLRSVRLSAEMWRSASPILRGRAGAAERARAALFAGLYGDGHPYARAARSPVSGGGALIRRADLEAVRASRFGAANGVLVLAGQFDRALARELVERWFGDMPRGQLSRVVRPPARPTARIITESTDASDPVTTVHIGFAPPDNLGRARRLVIERMVGERMQRVREALGASYSVRVVHSEGDGRGALLVTAQIDAARSAEAVRLLIDEISRLRAGDRDLAEAFVRARRHVLMEIVAETSGARSSADRIARLVARGERLGASRRMAREVMDLSMNDARSALAVQLDASRQVIAIVGSPASVAAARSVIGDAREHGSRVSPVTQ